MKFVALRRMQWHLLKSEVGTSSKYFVLNIQKSLVDIKYSWIHLACIKWRCYWRASVLEKEINWRIIQMQPYISSTVMKYCYTEQKKENYCNAIIKVLYQNCNYNQVVIPGLINFIPSNWLLCSISTLIGTFRAWRMFGHKGKHQMNLCLFWKQVEECLHKSFETLLLRIINIKKNYINLIKAYIVLML